jgi:hypothetical protein
LPRHLNVPNRQRRCGRAEDESQRERERDARRPVIVELDQSRAL